MWIATEINEHYDNDDAKTSFIKVAFDRQIASKKMLTLWDLNPSSPRHKIYTDYIDKWQKSGLVGGYQYEHFTIDDNLSITEERKKEIKSKYEIGSIWYQRNILGLRVTAEGIIYNQFANNPELFIREKPIDEYGNKINFMIISIGIDYGATEGETEFKATGITTLFKEVWTIDEMKLKGLHTPEQMYEKFKEFYYQVVNEYGKVTHCYADYGALGQVITYGLNRYLQQNNIPLRVQDCIKGKILERIELDCHLFATGKRFILSKCQYLIEAYKLAVWDEKHEDTRLDDGTTPIDDLDASEYSIFSFYDKLMMNIKSF